MRSKVTGRGRSAIGVPVVRVVPVLRLLRAVAEFPRMVLAEQPPGRHGDRARVAALPAVLAAVGVDDLAVLLAQRPGGGRRLERVEPGVSRHCCSPCPCPGCASVPPPPCLSRRRRGPPAASGGRT